MGVKPEDSIAQSLAKEWVEITRKVTGGNAEYEQAYLSVDEQREIWNLFFIIHHLWEKVFLVLYYLYTSTNDELIKKQGKYYEFYMTQYAGIAI